VADTQEAVPVPSGGEIWGLLFAKIFTTGYINQLTILGKIK
jgi:hypothetical protein